jgi:hypothetical protein
VHLFAPALGQILVNKVPYKIGARRFHIHSKFPQT